MAERKRLSETDTSPVNNNSKKIKLIQATLPLGTSKRPLCKYGAKCYRKHPDHLRDFDHPSTDKKEEEDEDEVEDVPDENSASSSPVKRTTISANSTISLMELFELNGEKLLSSLYQMEFPIDLYEFWRFCSTMNNKNPRGMKENFSTISYYSFFLRCIKNFI